MLAAILAIAPATVAPADLDRILDDTRLAGAHASVYVCDLGGKPIFERNSSSRVMPASNQKLLTCAFALFNLGPNYKPRTDIWKFPDRTIVDSPGDPLMTHDLLKKAAQRLSSILVPQFTFVRLTHPEYPILGRLTTFPTATRLR